MTGPNIWDQVNSQQQRKPKPSSVWDVVGISHIEEDENDWKERIMNRTRNIGNIIGAGVSVITGTVTPNQQKLIDTLKAGQDVNTQSSAIVRRDLSDPFDKVDVKETMKNLMSSTVSAVSHPIDSAVGLAKMLTIDMVSSLVGDTFRAVSGVDISKKEVTVLTPEEHASSTKMFVGNAIAAIAAPGISKAIEAGFARNVVSKVGSNATFDSMVARGLESEVTQQSIAQAGRSVPMIGAMGRAIIDDVGAGLGAGMAQGVIANANTPETLGAVATGMLFAPLGIVTGFVRGTKMKGVGKLEQTISDAHDASQVINNRNIRAANAAKEIKNIREWQEVGGVTMNEAAQKVEALIGSDDIVQALERGGKPAPVGADINTLYKDFREYLGADKPFDTALTEYVTEKGLGAHMNELRYKFAEKYIDAGPEIEVHQMRDVLNRAFKVNPYDAGDITSIASRHGFFITDEHGALKIRDVDTGKELYMAVTSEEAIAFMKESGNPANPIMHDSNSPLPTLGINVPNAPAAHQHMAAEWQPQYNDSQHMSNNPALRAAGFDIDFMNPLTGTAAYYKGLDTITAMRGEKATDWTNGVVEPAFREQRLYHRDIKNTLRDDMEIRELDRIVKQKAGLFGSKITKTELEQVSLLRETQTVAEMMAENGFHKGQTLRTESLDAGVFAHQNKVDLNRVQTYRRIKNDIKLNAIGRAKAKAVQSFDSDINIQSETGIDSAAMVDSYKSSISQFENDPVYIAEMSKLEADFVDSEHFKAAEKLFDDMGKFDNAGTSIAGAIRIKLALDSPDTHGLSRAEFITKHKLNKDQVRIAELLDGLYEKYGDQFNIQDSQRFVRFMNHYRQYGDILDTMLTSDFTRSIDDTHMRKFASDMIRTGEVLNFTTNPIEAFHAYLRGGKKKALYEKVNELFNAEDSPTQKNLRKMKGSGDKLYDNTVQRLNQLQNDLTGQSTISGKMSTEIQANIAKEMVLDETGRKMSREEIIAKLNQADGMDVVMNISSSSMLGLRVSMALRDNFDVTQKYNIRHGPQRTGRMMFTKTSTSIIDDLIDKGYIADPDPIDVLNVTHGTTKGGAIAHASRELAEFGYKGSLQPYVYMRNQAKTWIESTTHISKEIQKLSEDKITRKELDDNINLRMYDFDSQKAFNAALLDGNVEHAARILATQDVRELVGTMTRGNQSPVLNSKIGKVFGQFGSWGMTNRSVLQDLLTRGTREDIRRSHIRYATSLGAMMVTGQVTGLNLGRWLLLPTSVIATGGPLLQLAQSAQASTAATLGDSEAQQNFANRDFKRGLWQGVPYSYAVKDVKKAADLAAGGYGAGRVAAQAIGLPVNKENRSALDWMMGNYPEPIE